MPRYIVVHGYAANHNGRGFGPWVPGEEIELDEADAAWVDRDSPGALAEAVPAVPQPAAKAEARPARRPGGRRSS